MNKKTYDIPAIWHMCGALPITAESWDEALTIAEELRDLSYAPLPKEGIEVQFFEIDYATINEKKEQGGQ